MSKKPKPTGGDQQSSATRAYRKYRGTKSVRIDRAHNEGGKKKQ